MLPIEERDANQKLTNKSYSYDSLGNLTVKVKAPGEPGTYTSQLVTKSTCTISSTLPCLAMEANSSLYSTAVTRVFYDSLGRKVQTLTPGPGATQTTVTFTVYNDQNHTVFTSVSFVVAARTTWLDPKGATDITGTTPGGTITTFDALGRALIATDPLGNQTRTIYGIGSANGDSNVYATISTVDANQHVMMSYADLLGRPRYSFSFNGIYGGTLTSTMQFTAQYNALNKPTSITVTDLAPQSGQSITTVVTTNQYDDLGRQTVLTDPDRGTHTFTYNANGAVIKDVSGARTLGINYDLLGRSVCLQDAQPTPDPHGSCTSGANSFVKNTYDANPSGVTWTNVPIGRLTQAVATTTYPDGTQGIVTEQMQYDQRGQIITTRMIISGDALPTLPLYQQQLSYNNANQLTTTQTTVDGQPGYTFTQAYNSTTGVPIGLSNTSTGTPGLIELMYNEHALISDVIFKDTTGATLATKHQLYDGNLRPASSTATWQSGGTVYSDGISFDPVGNVISRVTTHAAVEGISGSGGNETQNFCYDAQNRLTWASNNISASPASGEHCGTATLQNQLGGSYLNRYVYTQLGQLWQGPLGGTVAQQQYLYCNSGQPHQMTHMSPLSDNPVCATPGTTAYTASYDAWGNMTTRTYNNQIGTMNFDALDHLTQWKVFAGSKQEQYLYDATGERVVRRSNDGTTTKLTVYAFGLEEHQYQEGSSLNSTGNTFYYVVGGNTIGMLTGTTTLSTTFLLTDTLGSVVSNFSNTASSAEVLGNQLYDPYGNQRYKQGEVSTDKGYTGQYSDSLTGLDYYMARYYDPLIGRFISADTVEGNLQGEDPYTYVGGNPQTMNDSTGHLKKRATDGTGSGNTVAVQSGGPPAGDNLLELIFYGLLGVTTIAAAEAISRTSGGETTSDVPTSAPAASVKTSVEKLINYTGQNEWTQQEQKADIVGNGGSGLSLETEQYRKAQIKAYQKNPKGPDPKGSTGGGAVLAIWDSLNGDKAVVLPLFALGFRRQGGKDYPHAEELLVGLATGVIGGRKLQLPNGYIVRVMMLIYSQNEVCPACNSKLDKWLQQLYNAAGGRAKVDLHVWHRMPPVWHFSRSRG